MDVVSMDPVVGSNPTILILGSMPGVKSIETQQYYAHPRNHFWPIISRLIKNPSLPDFSYEKRVEVIKNHGIAIWDVIESCYREGSLDSNIKDAKPNDLKRFLHEHATIQVVACNGSKAHTLFERYKKEHNLDIQAIKLPSTSPVPGRYIKTFEQKLDAWQALCPHIGGYYDTKTTVD
ncbi:DNA-deoxyinosine glycosylase [Paenalkalicoccus suaedae]|uniref:DNA-deoxyinosine glycosylase n=1 Tax=Paenalkalicoccus suaedae TaxID=2592382 RepID=A0A859FF83_9BACI|nr:DNA-deoxyinosine glycosylase [Paenalkalicoccus suaedae]QKS71244.1 DNA-deoxyinosine glycosylase [Paenalkalicoccus suaedae]